MLLLIIFAILCPPIGVPLLVIVLITAGLDMAGVGHDKPAEPVCRPKPKPAMRAARPEPRFQKLP